jgi:hypothetical protein
MHRPMNGNLRRDTIWEGNERRKTHRVNVKSKGQCISALGLCNKVPQIKCLETPEMYSFTLLEARSLK